MAKRIECGTSCFLRRKGCKDIRQCACTCGPLKSINPNLFDACVDQCNTGSFPTDVQDFKCNFVGADVLFNYYGLIDCGYTVQDSASWQMFEGWTDETKEANESSAKTTKVIVFTLALLIIMGFLSLLIKR
jgi:hypothetical protein